VAIDYLPASAARLRAPYREGERRESVIISVESGALAEPMAGGAVASHARVKHGVK